MLVFPRRIQSRTFRSRALSGNAVTVEHEKAILLKGGNLPLRRYVGQRESATTSPWSEIAIAYRVIGVQCFSFETSSSA
jgi:hypothetical protein